MKKKTEDLNSSFDEVLAARNTSIYYKLHKAKGEIGKVTKNAKNPFFKSNYADLNSLIECVEPALMKYDLILIQPVIEGKVCTQIIDISTGEKIESSLELPVITDPQKLITSITYYRRGTLQSLLSLQAVDDDGNDSSASVKKKTLDTKVFANVLQAVKEGKYTKQKIRNAYTLTTMQKIELDKIN